MATFFTVTRADITKVNADAIVNAANNTLLGGGGVDGAIHRAGGPSILKECKEIRKRQAGCKTGDAVITNAGLLAAKKVIHTVGPVYMGGKNNEANLLASCYTTSLQLAKENSLRTIAFPNISTGVYRYPKQEAAIIAVNTTKEFVNTNPDAFDEILFVCFDSENEFIYRQLLNQ
jgi:O-acetyl-ADP-ribose deacetylase (regulator of RNase III)